MLYSRHLSPTADVENQTRKFTDDDLRLFAAVDELRQRGVSYDDIGTTLDNGYRVDPPDMPAVIMTGSSSKELVALKQQIEVLNSQLQQARVNEIKQAGQIEILERHLSEARKQIDQLNRQVGKLEGKLDKDD